MRGWSVRWNSQGNLNPTQTEKDCTTSHGRKYQDRMKYFSKKVKTTEGVFDSKAEYERYLYLKHQEDIGAISDLKCQVEFEVFPKQYRVVRKELKTKIKYERKFDEHPIHYTADFTYYNNIGQYVISEVKSVGTAMARDYPLRKKLIKKLVNDHNESYRETHDVTPDYEDWVFEEYVSTKKKRKK